MTLFLSRWKVDRKKEKYISKEATEISGKNARECMAAFNDLKNRSDLFGFTPWVIYNITDK